jgi:phenylalanyl-tRNA synthetase alpha chain
MAMSLDDMKKAIAEASSPAALEELRVAYLGRKGSVTESLKAVGKLPPEGRSEAGKQANELRLGVEALLAKRGEELTAAEMSTVFGSAFDVTVPGIRPAIGHRHPVSRMLDDLVDVFWQMGYQAAEGPEVETEWHNFEACWWARPPGA